MTLDILKEINNDIYIAIDLIVKKLYPKSIYNLNIIDNILYVIIDDENQIETIDTNTTINKIVFVFKINNNNNSVNKLLKLNKSQFKSNMFLNISVIVFIIIFLLVCFFILNKH